MDLILGILFFILYTGLGVLVLAFIVSKANVGVAKRMAAYRGRKFSGLYAEDGSAKSPTGLLSQCGTNIELKVVIDDHGARKLKVAGSTSVSTINSDMLLLK